MHNVFSGKTASSVWVLAAEELISMEDDVEVESRIGSTKELLHTLIHLDNPIQRWVTMRTPPMSISFALAELIWILAGSNDANVINFWNPSLSKYSGNASEYHGAYGYRLRHSFGFDQLKSVYNTLRNNQYSRQAVMLLWDPTIDTPNDDGKPVNSDIPCNVCSMLKVRNNKLEWTQVMRSNDIYRGLPYNFIQFTSLQEIIAGWLGLDVGSYCHYSDSLHVYQNDLDTMRISVRPEINNSDRLHAGYDETQEIVGEIFRNMVEISSGKLSEADLLKKSKLSVPHSGYQNILLMIILYVANKSNFTALAKFLIDRCTNELFIELWNAWKGRHNNG